MKYYSNGKILLTAEYMVLFGATALAMPVRFGQSLEVNAFPGEEELEWESDENGEPWFRATFHTRTLDVLSATDGDVAARLRDHLLGARELNPSFLTGNGGYLVRTEIQFNRFWGLGTSSSLLSNIAWWAGVDPYELHRRVSRGSGFDIACARSNTPLLYSVTGGKPRVVPTSFCPPFKDNIYFVYLGKKQNSEDSVREFLRKHPPREETVNKISDLTHRIHTAGDLGEFDRLIGQHESILSGLSGVPSVRESLLADFPGGVKSLGAWGGDFIMVTWDGPFSRLQEFLREHGLETIILFREMILRPEMARP
ncbi:MAG TPA: GHMP kinase [Bacteroidetes bacterium]|nr:GHMP kinase [Bacteroidota bacterium]